MRIISGKFRGMQLASPPGKNKTIRPTSDRCREALFSILGEKVVAAKILDLYAGTGALSFESISRGAHSAYLIDNSTVSLSLIHKNIQLLKKYVSVESDIFRRINVVKHDLRKGMGMLMDHEHQSKSVFDIIFLDPPYGKGIAQKTLEFIDKADILADKAIVVAEEFSKVSIAEKFSHLVCFDTRKYGDTTFWLYKHISESI